jgi:hypothetical protein
VDDENGNARSDSTGSICCAMHSVAAHRRCCAAQTRALQAGLWACHTHCASTSPYWLAVGTWLAGPWQAGLRGSHVAAHACHVALQALHRCRAASSISVYHHHCCSTKTPRCSLRAPQHRGTVQEHCSRRRPHLVWAWTGAAASAPAAGRG